jgi:hypothetical protein
MMEEKFNVLMFNSGDYDFTIEYFETLERAKECFDENKNKYLVCLLNVIIDEN